MLGKLLKHEFRATGRTMLPVYAAIVALTVLANISIRFMQATDLVFLRILFGLIIAAFVIGVIAVVVLTAVITILRFYRNLLKDEGYLMHTLPVTVHGLIGSKLIVSLVWFAATWLVAFLAVMLTLLIQSGTDLGELLIELPTWAELRTMLLENGVSMGSLVVLALEAAAYAILYILQLCLHVYAAMAIGHCFAKNKVLLSVVFFIVISFVFSMFGTGCGYVVLYNLNYDRIDTAVEMISYFQGLAGRMLIAQLGECALLYAAVFLGLKKGLNLN